MRPVSQMTARPATGGQGGAATLQGRCRGVPASPSPVSTVRPSRSVLARNINCSLAQSSGRYRSITVGSHASVG